MASKEVADRQKATNTVGSALEQSLGRVEQHYFTGFHIAPAVTREFVGKIIGGLRATTDALVAADLANESELADDAPLRARRETVLAEVGKWLQKTRSDAETHHGDAGAQELGFDGPTPEDPQQRANHAALVVSKLKGWRVRPSELEGEKFDPKRWLTRLAGPAEQLRTAITDIAREVGEAKGTLTEKMRRMDDHDRQFSGVAGLATALLNAVGEKELARRTRPSGRSPGRTTEQDEGAAPAPVAPLEPTG